MCKSGKCNSDYFYGKTCDGINQPKKCPYRKGCFAMAVQDNKNRRKNERI